MAVGEQSGGDRSFKNTRSVADALAMSASWNRSLQEVEIACACQGLGAAVYAEFGVDVA